MNILKTYCPNLLTGLLAFILLLLIQPYGRAAVINQQVISNMAIGEYTEEGSTVVQVSRSNLVQTTILPVYSLNLVAANSKMVTAGQTTYFNHTLSNTGNDTDQYTFAVTNNTGDGFDFTNSSFAVYLDVNNDGVPDGAAITSYALAAGQSVGLVVAATVPSTAVSGQNALLTLTVNSQNSATGTKTNIDTATVTNQSALIVRKKFSQVDTTTGSIVTIRLDYRNPSSVATGTVTLTDSLGSDLSYTTGSENWNGTSVNPATGPNDPSGINYSVSSNVVTAVLTSVPANSVGYIEFRVSIVKSSAGKINNTIAVQYDHDNSTSTAVISDVSNTAVITVSPIYNVKINGSANNISDSTAVVVPAVTQGAELKFNNYVWNSGNTTDIFNLSLTNSTFPAGSQIEFYRADGVTPLLDSNADGIVDTGPLVANANLPIVVKVRFPSGYAVTSNTSYKLFPQAQSVGDSTKTSNIEDQGSLKPVANLVDLTNSPENNAVGNGALDNSGNAWKTVTASSSTNSVTGGQAIFPLKVSHTGTGTEYILNANATNNFSQLILPVGVNQVRFYQSSNGTDCSILGKEIGKTRYLNDGENQLVCAVAEVDQVNANTIVPIYFRALSTSLVSMNNSSNPSQDILKNAITIQSKNAFAQIEFTPDLRGQVAPLGTVVYSHLLINHSNVALTGNYDFVVTNDHGEFTASVYYDANNNGQFDSNDVVVTSLADLPNGQLAAQAQARLFVRVTNTIANNLAQVNTTTVSLKNSTQTIGTVVDVTTVNKSQLSLSKLQARDTDCNGVADEAYTSNTLTIGPQANGQGQCVLYKVLLTNLSATSLNSTFTFRDRTPAYTILSKLPNCTACSSTTSPNVGSSGVLTGTLNSVLSGQTYEFNFGVRYVGQ